MREFFKRMKKTLLFAGLISALWGLVLLLMNGIWWLQDNWVMPDQLRATVMWIILLALIGLAVFASWNLLKILYTGFRWLFIEPFKKSKTTK
ncbi:hypothetical protein [Paenibacillus xylanexedens]|uniref:hypothetical protein n=1 Tax=Paenibacillus xylanexedens TaxID=528191 RepID=UPI000F525118|nr:hypothetical protein [Paenibacillus xylanexedens]